jgi:hypothetical protein
MARILLNRTGLFSWEDGKWVKIRISQEDLFRIGHGGVTQKFWDEVLVSYDDVTDYEADDEAAIEVMQGWGCEPDGNYEWEV